MTYAIPSARNLTTHVALVLDRSGSMAHLQSKTVQVADDLVAYLAEQSKKMGQEWRVSIYTFGDDVTCHIWNMDVLRLPSMKEFYKIDGMTALVDATFLALADADKITEHRGDHAFLTYVLTDGFENASRGNGPAIGFGRVPKEELARQMHQRLGQLKENRTLAILVPSEQGAREARDLGFENILLWETSEDGLERASQAIQASTTTYMHARTQGAVGLRSMKSGLFVGGNVDAQAIKAAKLKPLAKDGYAIVPVVKVRDLAFEKVVKKATKTRDEEKGWFVEIEPFVNRAHPPFRVGKAYYELVKTERLQGNKQIAVLETKSNRVFVGSGARQLLGLPEETRTVKPDINPDYRVYVQSTSLNRHLPIGSNVLLLTS